MKMKILIGLIFILIFSGCELPYPEYYFKYDFCTERLHSFSNATEIYRVYKEQDFIGCSDGTNIKWYSQSSYVIAKSLNETGSLPRELQFTLYEDTEK